MTPSLNYLKGFGNYFQSEAIPDVLLKGRNSPQKVPYGLYAEQISGTAFTMPRGLNLHSWFYRTQPSVVHDEFQLVSHPHFSEPTPSRPTPPTQMRWDPRPYPLKPEHFVESWTTIAVSQQCHPSSGAAIHLYAATKEMQQCYFYNADGDLLVVLQEGALHIKTEYGAIFAEPGEIIVIPRGIKFQVLLPHQKARGYICENFGLPFRLPELGILGANALANPKDFEVPVAAYETLKGPMILLVKFNNRLWSANIDHSPLNVVAWQGNYVPYKYDLKYFNTMNTVSFDHPDPSIFTVLTSPSSIAGTANVDFVIFPPRWMVANDTFRLPYYHRNIMNEYMGLIYGVYDAKENGFKPGGASCHNSMSAHGPDAAGFLKASESILEPEYYDNTLAFMFESQQIWQLTPYALEAPFRQKQYLECWQGLKTRFVTENFIK